MATRTSHPLSPKIAASLACLIPAAYAIGFVTARSTIAAEETRPPAYTVVNSKLLKPDAIAAYREAAGPSPKPPALCYPREFPVPLNTIQRELALVIDVPHHRPYEIANVP